MSRFVAHRVLAPRVICDLCNLNYTSLGVQRVSPKGDATLTSVCEKCEQKFSVFKALLEGDKEGATYYPVVLTTKGWKLDEEFLRELDSYIYVNS